nr:MAG TPA: Mitochondrial morphogenesis protein SLD7 helix, REPLICATION REGULATOR [Microviridae sp.]
MNLGGLLVVFIKRIWHVVFRAAVFVCRKILKCDLCGFENCPFSAQNFKGEKK